MDLHGSQNRMYGFFEAKVKEIAYLGWEELVIGWMFL